MKKHEPTDPRLPLPDPVLTVVAIVLLAALAALYWIGLGGNI